MTLILLGNSCWLVSRRFISRPRAPKERPCPRSEDGALLSGLHVWLNWHQWKVSLNKFESLRWPYFVKTKGRKCKQLCFHLGAHPQLTPTLRSWGNLDSPSTSCACFWSVGGSWSVQRKPTQVWGRRARPERSFPSGNGINKRVEVRGCGMWCHRCHIQFLNWTVGTIIFYPGHTSI